MKLLTMQANGVDVIVVITTFKDELPNAVAILTPKEMHVPIRTKN